jgi:hypothetical protein
MRGEWRALVFSRGCCRDTSRDKGQEHEGNKQNPSQDQKAIDQDTCFLPIFSADFAKTAEIASTDTYGKTLTTIRAVNSRDASRRS